MRRLNLAVGFNPRNARSRAALAMPESGDTKATRIDLPMLPGAAACQLETCTRGLLSLSRRDKTTVAQQFIAGIARITQLSPGGTAEGY